jgi:hypothetical protein
MRNGFGAINFCAMILTLLALSTAGGNAAEPAGKPALNLPPTAADWAALARLPDWSGVWIPKISDQDVQRRNQSAALDA